MIVNLLLEKFKLFISSVKDGLKNNKGGVKHNLFKGDDFSVSYCFLFEMSLNIEILVNSKLIFLDTISITAE